MILRLDGLGSATDRTLFTRSFLLWLYYHRLAQGRSATSKHVLFVEEAHNLFLRRTTEDSAIQEHVLRQMRDLGESFVLLDQNPSLLSTPALGNTGVTICLNLKHADDVEAAAKALTMPREDWHHIGRLPVGHAIVRVQDRWEKPFLVRFPRFPASSLVVRPRTGRRDAGGPSVQQAVEEFRSVVDEAIRVLRGRDRRQNTEPGISARERSLLCDIAHQPLSVVTERYERLEWSAHRGTKTKDILLEKGLIDQEKVRTPSGSVTLLKATGRGGELLASWGIETKGLPKNASLEHEYWKRLVADRYRGRGYAVEEEVALGNGKAVDLVARKAGEHIAIEIETGKSDIHANMRKCADAAFDKVVVVRTMG